MFYFFINIVLFYLLGMYQVWPNYGLFFAYGSVSKISNSSLFINLSDEYLNVLHEGLFDYPRYWHVNMLSNQPIVADLTIISFYLDNLGFYNERFQYLFFNWFSELDTNSYIDTIEELCYFNEIFKSGS